MTFIQFCCVRVGCAGERKEVVKWLLCNGYNVGHLESGQMVVIADKGIVSTSDIDFVGTLGCIDCGINIGLFKALAAMNDENDREQWFINDNYAYVGCVMWHLCDEEKFKHYYIEWEDGETDIRNQFRKATTEEVIEHFKTLNQ